MGVILGVFFKIDGLEKVADALVKKSSGALRLPSQSISTWSAVSRTFLTIAKCSMGISAEFLIAALLFKVLGNILLFANFN
eukprot:CAMPEP_0169155834 /NCGR_PEP_ID=MMETSP1015-20121227/53612_1 /TAXON_ID=342587 /ORGANISM="Karlodinium micrum, Strain CCMP2283" /LENGTH=80 /DNA_ID=CAMNT_0009226429 /DNA_START=222 /DNA_END=461 /DNA_ORIENTATION=+